jgi:hypothetical protein
MVNADNKLVLKSGKELELVDRGGNRELYADLNKKSPVAVVKLKALDWTVDNLEPESDEFKHKKIELLDTLDAEQVLPREVFKDIYIAPRFLNVIDRNGKYYLVTHEKYRKDIYPSEDKENILDLCFLPNLNISSYLGMANLDLEPGRYGYYLGLNSLFGEKFNDFNKYPKLQNITKSEESSIAVKEYLDAVEDYKNLGFRLDLAGGDNVVLANYDDGKSEVVINNSAVKIERIDSLEKNLRKILDKDKDKYNIKFELDSQISGMVNINLICDIVNRPRIFTFDSQTEIDLKEVLMDWNSYYIE